MRKRQPLIFYMKKAFKVSFLHTLPVLAGYIFLGFAFGLLLKTSGFPAWLPVVMSIVIYSGAQEFAAVSLLLAPFDPFGTFIIGIMLSARHLFYGLPMLKKYAGQGKKKPFLIFGLTDETFSILTTHEPPEGVEAGHFYLWITLLDYAYWVAGTALGALTGQFISFDVTGLDFALTALFIVLFLEQLKKKEGRISACTGLIVTAAVLALFGSTSMVVISMAVILLVLVAGRRVIDR